jgi:catechol 2,3-dioxygenase
MVGHPIGQDVWLCQGPERRLLIGRGQSKTFGFVGYRCETEDDLAALRVRLVEQGVRLAPSPSPLFSEEAFSFSDPDGNYLVFGLSQQQFVHENLAAPLQGRLQHLAFASDNAETLVHFYTDVVGLLVSDKMVEGTAITACWMRAADDKEHHSLAIFHKAEKGLDHYSYELRDWGLIRDWADHFAAKGIKLSWGPGRHGPGNNLFIFVYDPDGNWIELSTELEIMNGRPVGVWRNEPDTLNCWGAAVMRS